MKLLRKSRWKLVDVSERGELAEKILGLYVIDSSDSEEGSK